MSVYFAIPSKRPEAESTLRLWRERGYKLAIWRDLGDPPVDADLLMVGRYPGYARVVNALCKAVIATDPAAEWIVSGGDDIMPDPNRAAEQIAAEMTAHFAGTFGVCQPTGDRWGHGGYVYAEHIAGSPWIGRDFARRMYCGEGPLWPGWAHCYEDDEIQQVAVKLGVFWQRSDLIHFHAHWGRRPGGKCPDWLERGANTFHTDRAVFEERKAAGFPGHQPLPV